MNRVLRNIVIASIAALPLAVPACAQSTASQAISDGSQLSAIGAAQIVEGGSRILVGGATLVVASVRPVGDLLEIALRGAGESGIVVLRVAGSTAGAGSIAVGESIQVVGEATGYALIRASEVIAYVPNEAAKAMLFHRTYEAGR